MSEAMISDKEFEFSLQSEEQIEEITIWSAYNLRNEEVKDGNGNVLEFPIRDGSIVGDDKKERTFEQITKIPNPLFKRFYPRLGRTKRFLRPILIEGEEMWGVFPQTANTKLNEVCKMLTAQKESPMNYIFKKTYDSNQQAAKMYGIEIVKKLEANPQQEVKINVEGMSVTAKMTVREKSFMDEVNKLETKLEEEKFRELCAMNSEEDDKIDADKLWGIYNG